MNFGFRFRKKFKVKLKLKESESTGETNRNIKRDAARAGFSGDGDFGKLPGHGGVGKVAGRSKDSQKPHGGT